MKSQEIFTEIDFFSQSKAGNSICGDSFSCRQADEEGRRICVLSDGLGSGIRASVLSSLTATMAINYMARNESILYTAEAIIRTLARDPGRQTGYATFCIIDTDCFGYTKIIEYETPACYLFRKDSPLSLPRRQIPVQREDVADTRLYISEVRLEKEDRIICFTDGISQSGMGHSNMPEGWQEGVETYIRSLIRRQPSVPAGELARKIVTEAEKNDGYRLLDDATCCVVYLRTPRNLLVCTGPPFDKNNDSYLARRVKDFSGKKLVCGGTTAHILARELRLPLKEDSSSTSAGTPPGSQLEGIDLVTEGILTLSQVERLLSGKDERTGAGPAREIVKLLHDSDKICFLVGTGINIAHQDPNLPVELEIRRNVVRKIKFLLEKKFFKNAEITYL